MRPDNALSLMASEEIELKDIEKNTHFWTSAPRDQILDEMIINSSRAGGFTVLHGAAGVGKSSLLDRAYTQLSSRMREVLLVSYAASSLSTQILMALTRYFGIQIGDHKDWSIYSEHLKSKMAHLNAPFVLLVDFQKLDHITEDSFQSLRWIEELCDGQTNFMSIVSMRQRLYENLVADQKKWSSVDVKEVKPLNENEMKSYFLRTIQDANIEIDTFSKDAVQSIITRSKGLLEILNPMVHGCITAMRNGSSEKIDQRFVDVLTKRMNLDSEEQHGATSEPRGHSAKKINLRDLLLIES